MVNLNLTTWERTQLSSVIGVQQGDAGQLRRWFRILDVLELSIEEKEQVGWREWQEPATCPHCAGLLQHRVQSQFAWDDAELTFDLIMEDEDFTLFQGAILNWPHWRATLPVRDLLGKLEAAA